ncbi:MAG: methyltransferase domain-containing protein [Candidatus Thorarchaeota archaeon]|nr:methyltransferase domain-containing protein [Candidatus Thorarchaeota archaeon]NIW15106.1 methyltransferase domain-containing protein [Candidatus Thorarchaeota archaeon]NIW53120.1 methyltransferase domain-containing protein [Candidatus Korarchaeota archaeon]
MDELVEKCRVDEESHVLDVGCGTGGNAAYLSKKCGCHVTGIDISELMVEKARMRAEELGMEEKLTFSVGDAYLLDFSDESFDAVITVFVSQFLDLGKAFPDFNRVLRKGGYLGINEMYRENPVPEEFIKKVDYAEQVFQELTNLPFRLRSPIDWKQGFDEAGFRDVSVETKSDLMDVTRGWGMIEDFGGWLKTLSIFWRMSILALRSKKIRDRYRKISRGKRVMFNDRETSKFFGYVLGTGRKPI